MGRYLMLLFVLVPALSIFSCGSVSSDHDVLRDAPAGLDSSGEVFSDGVALPGDLVQGTDLPDDSLDEVLEVLPQSRVRAFIIQDEAEQVSGREAEARIGDLRIENEHLVAVIGAAGHSRWSPYGGGILDLAPAGEPDFFEEQFPIAGFIRTLGTDSVQILKDGSEREAVIRVTGRDRGIPILASILPMPPVNLEVVVDYVLREDSPCLLVRTTVTNLSNNPVSALLGDVLVFSESGRIFGSGVGFDVEQIINQGRLQWIGSDQTEVSYLAAPDPGDAMSMLLSSNELNAVQYALRELEPGGSAGAERCLYAVKGRSLNALELFWRDRGIELALVETRALIATPDYPLEQLSLEVSRDGEFFGTAGPDDQGGFSFFLPPGSYTGVLRGEGLSALQVEWTVEAGRVNKIPDLDPEDPGRLEVEVTDGQGQAIPSRITMYPGEAPGLSAGRIAADQDLEGKGLFFLAPGTYTAQGSRGPDWSYCRVPAEIVAGQVSRVSCAITQEVLHPGWKAGDMHNHCEWSIDSQYPREERVLSEIVEGLDLVVTTDHDLFTDLGPTVRDLGVEDLLLTVVGSEVSPIGHHYNALGCSPSPDQQKVYGILPWVNFDSEGEVSGNRLSPDMWRSMREDFGCKAVQVNHPRDTQGYLDLIGYDPALGPDSAKPGMFDWTFDAMEVWNSTDDWDHMESYTLPDWYSFLNRGHRVTATGNPDSHQFGQWAGQPHNLAQIDGQLTEDAWFDAILAGRTQLTSGPVILFTIQGQGLGATVVPQGQPIQAGIRVEAASWVPLTTVRLIGNGELIREWDVSAAEGIVRLEVTEDLTPEVDTWYHVVAFARTGSMAPLYPGRTSAALTNPIRVDLAGDGFQALLTD